MVTGCHWEGHATMRSGFHSFVSQRGRYTLLGLCTSLNARLGHPKGSCQMLQLPTKAKVMSGLYMWVYI